MRAAGPYLGVTIDHDLDYSNCYYEGERPDVKNHVTAVRHIVAGTREEAEKQLHYDEVLVVIPHFQKK